MNDLVSDDQLKRVLKTALVEILQERGDLLRDLVDDALEDVALVRAIQEGETSELVDRSAIFEQLGART